MLHNELAQGDSEGRFMPFGDVTKQSSPARQLVPPRADVIPMRAIRTNAIRSRLSVLLNVLLAPLAGLCTIAGLMTGHVLAADEPRSPLAIQFSLDRPIDAAAAPFVMATAGGLFGAEALAVTTNIASGSLDAMARVAAGTSGFATRISRVAPGSRRCSCCPTRRPMPSSPARAAASAR